MLDRFWSKVNKTEDCWTWTGCKVRGYGQFSISHGRRVGAHRYAYEQVVGPIPQGFQIDHLCRNPACVRPDHLEAVTALVNTQRSTAPTMLLNLADRCREGHSLANAYVNKRGNRHCRPCRNAYQRVWKARRKAAA